MLLSNMDQQSPNFPDSFARVTVKGLYIKDGKILLCRDETGLDYSKGPVWELPGGGWDFGETFADTLRREASEEMGLEVASVSDRPLYAWPLRKENSRGMDFHYALIMLFQVDFKDLNFTPSIECRELGFFTHDEFMALPDLYIQTQPLRNLITKEDFEKSIF